MASPVVQRQKICLQCRRQRRCGINPWVGKIPWRRKGQITSVFLPGECHSEEPGEGARTHTYTHTYITLCLLSLIPLFATLWTVACQALLSTGFSRQEYWNGLPSPPPGDLPDPGIEPASISLLHWRADSLPQEPPGKPRIL